MTQVSACDTNLVQNHRTIAESAELLRHRALAARCCHPLGGTIEFSNEDLDLPIATRFEKIAAEQPDRIAVDSADALLTYRQLDETANRLAQVILNRLGPPSASVGMLVEHSANTIIAILAVFKAGKILVPLDPNYPRERLAFMLGDTNASLILTDRLYRSEAAELANDGIQVVEIDAAANDFPTSPPEVAIGPDDLAAIYYTSGSTGRPKGIVYTHRYLMHNMQNYGAVFQVSPYDRWTWLHSIGFSPASTDILCPLLHGACVCPWDLRRFGLAGLAPWLIEKEITVFHWMATPFRNFAATLEQNWSCPNVRLTIFGGEKLFARDVAAFQRFFSPECIFANRLGASETGLFQMYFFDRETPLDEGVVPAGYPVSGKTAVIFDDNGSELPTGQIGEIGVHSTYLPPGYWNQPELTRAKFRNLKNGTVSRIYMTGDLGQPRADGCLDYLGRKDSQVKIRGQRVELGEIENSIGALDGIREAAVKVIEASSGQSTLVCYFVLQLGAVIDDSMLREHLLQRLPDYMVPTFFLQLEQMPQNANGKIDLAALPPLDSASRRSEHFAPPETPLHCRLVEIWESVLEIHPIGIDDDFFALGGDSLTAMRMLAKLQSEIEATVLVPTLFDNPTVRSLATLLESSVQMSSGSLRLG